ncbi:MAG: response regulator transcription factor [Myxococcota bacterium]|nr:response regulator transcription factor [Myxococcota bacterium]
MTRILLVDDHGIFLQGLRALLSQRPDVEVVGEVTEGRAALEVAAECRPDVVIMDLSMPGMNGMDATRQLVKRFPDTKVLCLSMHAESLFVEAALEAGAAGYLLKDCVLDELARAIRTVVSGRVYLSPAIAGTVVEALKTSRSETPASAFSILTDRERAVLQLLAEGFSTKEIAARLHLSVKTIGTHREHIMAKLDIRSVAGLTKYAIREGLTSTAA